MGQETRSKVVVRLLPPSLTEDAFKKVIEEWLEAIDWISYWKGKPRFVYLLHCKTEYSIPIHMNTALLPL